MKNARPHPGPLPQERENGSPVSGDGSTRGVRPTLDPHKFAAAIANTATELSDTVVMLSLSPGERAGVRASVTTNFLAATRRS